MNSKEFLTRIQMIINWNGQMVFIPLELVFIVLIIQLSLLLVLMVQKLVQEILVMDISNHGLFQPSLVLNMLYSQRTLLLQQVIQWMDITMRQRVLQYILAVLVAPWQFMGHSFSTPTLQHLLLVLVSQVELCIYHKKMRIKFITT